MKDLEINELSQKLKVNNKQGDLGDFDFEGQFNMIHKQSPKISQHDEFIPPSRSPRSQSEDLNIYGEEVDNEEHLDYKNENQTINKDITGDNFNAGKRVKTLNQTKLQQSIENLDLVGSRSSLIDRNVLNSKLYQDLEA